MSKYFNINDFKKWMKEHQHVPHHSPFIGMYVESKLGHNRLLKKSEPESNNEESLAEIIEYFVENGGTVKDVDGHWFTIQTDYGAFIVPRMYVRRA